MNQIFQRAALASLTSLALSLLLAPNAAAQAGSTTTAASAGSLPPIDGDPPAWSFETRPEVMGGTPVRGILGGFGTGPWTGGRSGGAGLGTSGGAEVFVLVSSFGVELGLTGFTMKVEEAHTGGEESGDTGTTHPEPKWRRPPDDSDYVANAGEVVFGELDAFMAGRGLNFSWVRTYRSSTLVESTHGTGWDHSYNIYLEQAPQGLELNPGNGRSDLFTLRANGNYTRSDYFIIGQSIADGSFTFTWPDGSTWNFKGFDGSPAEGRLETIVDGAGNTMTLAYDGLGRLATITDTLARVVTVNYTAGRIASVQTPTQTWSYDYYGPADPDGPGGDLRSATTPAVSGTPGFPSGKTTRYTYSTGLANPRLNHNLLTIQDPPGQALFTHTYAPTTNAGDIEFDRVASMTVHSSSSSSATTQFHYADRIDPSNGDHRLLIVVNASETCSCGRTTRGSRTPPWSPRGRPTVPAARSTPGRRLSTARGRSTTAPASPPASSTPRATRSASSTRMT